MDRELPLTLQLPMPFEAAVYSSPEGRGITVEGRGSVTLTFEPTPDPSIAHVVIEDIWVRLSPTRIPFDIDRDGQLEHIELEGLELTADAFDLGRSGGEYNLESGDISLTFVFFLTPDKLGPIGERIGPEPIHFEIAERGWFDLETGNFRTHSNLFTIPEGPFEGLSILGGQGCADIDSCYATVYLGVGLAYAPPSIWDGPPQNWRTEAYICPNDPIRLAWDSTNAGNVYIGPTVGTYGPKGSQAIPDPIKKLDPILNTTSFWAQTRNETGGCSRSGKAVADIYVLKKGDEISQDATCQPEYPRWVTKLPDHCYSRSILVEEVTILSKPGGITHDLWRLDHQYQGKWVGTKDLRLGTPTLTSAVHPLPGEYIFTPDESYSKLPPSDMQRRLYFRLKVKCRI